eukprot:Nitzschia sp. Nitz4//scaffold212_size37733//24646//26299//NITZ4_007737-RA/size37733-snap-gene-0.78-mRNA-1//1//CDS//3329542034//6788//frame0
MSKGMEQWDLTSKISPYLDRHMMFPLLEYMHGQIADGTFAYKSEDVAAARLALLRPTHLVDYAFDMYKMVHPDATELPKDLAEQKDNVFKRLAELEKGCEPLMTLIANEEEKSKLQASGKWSAAALIQSFDHAISQEVVDTYREMAKFKFECGDYVTARDMLANYISLYAKPPAAKTGSSEDDDLLAYSHAKKEESASGKEEVGNPAIYYLPTVNDGLLQVLWGKLAAEILAEGWAAASVAVEAVKTAIEIMVSSQRMSPIRALTQRTWLLHWALFVYWNNSSSGGLENLVELFHTEKYKQAITTNAPHLLRYLTAAVLLCKRRISKKAAVSANPEARRLMKQLVNVMQDCDYSDPIVEFVNCLCVKFDFESAQTKLQECEQVLYSDFFLCQQTDLFMEEARVFVFENYCRIHNKIDLSALGTKLGMNQEEAERWIVDLIRNADLDAIIDTKEGCVVMGGSVQSVYEQVMERTRDLNVRSATMVQTLNNRLNEARKEKAKRAQEALEAEE